MAARITSLSHREVGEGAGHHLFVNGEDFHEVTAVWFGQEWSPDYRVDGTTTITVEVPVLPPGAYYVVVQTADGAYSEQHDQCVVTVRAADDGPGAATLHLDSVTPDTATSGRSSQHWVKGTGMLAVSAVVLGSSACTFEATDDETLVVTVPEQLRDVTPGSEAALWVYPRSGNALSLPLSVQHEPVPERPSVGFMVWSADPERLGATGGQVVLAGDGLDGATRALLGNVECVIAGQERGRLVLEVPPLDGLQGQFLVATVVSDSEVASNATSAGVRVAA